MLSNRHVLCLVLILFLAAALRFIGLNWDEGSHNHPDERFLTMVVEKLSFPATLSEYFDTDRSSLNPHNREHPFFVYGTLPLFLVRGVGELTKITNYDRIHLLGRALSALFDTLSVGLIFCAGNMLYGAGVGVLAAFLLACSVLNIQQAHFFVVEPYLVFFTTLTLCCAIVLGKRGQWVSYLVCGVVLGAAMACKVTALALFVPITLATILDGIRSFHTRSSLSEPIPKLILRKVASLFLLLVAAYASFRIFQPYAFKAHSLWELNPKVLANFHELYGMSSEGGSFPPIVQWSGRSFWFPLKNIVLWGLGPALGAAAIFGWFYCAYELLRRRKIEHAIPLAWSATIFIFHSAQYVKIMRYFLPAYPFFILLGAYAILKLVEWLKSRWGDALPITVSLATLFWACAFVSIYVRPFVRIEASRWNGQHVPPHATVGIEHWDDSLPMAVDGRMPGPYHQIELKMFDYDSPKKREGLLDALAELDYIFINSERAYGAVPRRPNIFPMTIRYYEKLFKGELGFELAATFTNYPSLFGVTFLTDRAEESFTVYEHPKALIFKKVQPFTREQYATLIDFPKAGERLPTDAELKALVSPRR